MNQNGMLIFLLTTSLFGTASAHNAEPDREAVSLETLFETVGIDPDSPVTVQQLGGGFYVLFGIGGNILVSSGADGVLIIDDQFPLMMPRLRAAMLEQGDQRVDFAVNTHWHFDHADGNRVLGAEGTWLVSQTNSRQKLQSDQRINMGAMTYLSHAWLHEFEQFEWCDGMTGGE
ncbi:MAG: hypothetical protein SH820_06975 [Xanthomonadales bacterium]|nr:hypothetical protein [Xanthomonadales bacterium]